MNLKATREAREALQWLTRRLAWEHRFRELRGEVARRSADRVA